MLLLYSQSKFLKVLAFIYNFDVSGNFFSSLLFLMSSLVFWLMKTLYPDLFLARRFSFLYFFSLFSITWYSPCWQYFSTHLFKMSLGVLFYHFINFKKQVCTILQFSLFILKIFTQEFALLMIHIMSFCGMG